MLLSKETNLIETSECRSTLVMKKEEDDTSSTSTATTTDSSTCSSSSSSSSNDNDTATLLLSTDDDSFTQMKKARSVTFFPSVDVVWIRHLSEYEPSEISSLWTTNAEKALNKSECTRTCNYLTKLGRKYLTQDEEESLGICSRGLEYRTLEGFKQRRMRKQNARVAVLMFQQQQKQFGVGTGGSSNLDPDASKEATANILAAIYQKHSIPCQEAANEIGVYDAQIALDLQDEGLFDQVSDEESSSSLSKMAPTPGSSYHQQSRYHQGSHLLPNPHGSDSGCRSYTSGVPVAA